MNKLLLRIAAKLKYNDIVNLDREKFKNHLYEEYISDMPPYGLNIKGRALRDNFNITEKIDTIIQQLKAKNKSITPTIICNQLLESSLAQDIRNKIGSEHPSYEYDQQYQTDLQYIIEQILSVALVKSHLSRIEYNWITMYNEDLKANKPKRTPKKTKAEETNQPTAQESEDAIIKQYMSQLQFNSEFKNAISDKDKLFINYLNSEYTSLPKYITETHFSKDIIKTKLKNVNTNINNNMVNKIYDKIYDIIERRSNMDFFKLNMKRMTADAILPIISQKINDILPRVIKWPRAENFSKLYKHSWLGWPDEMKNDARPVFQYLADSNNINYCNSLFDNKFTVKQIIDHVAPDKTWKALLMDLYDNYRDQTLERTVRQYLIDKNLPIFQQYSDKLRDNGDKIHQSINLEFNPRKDQYRTNPIIVYRDYNAEDFKLYEQGKIKKENIRFVDRVIKGELGDSHPNLLLSIPDETYRNNVINEDVPFKAIITMAY